MAAFTPVHPYTSPYSRKPGTRLTWDEGLILRDYSRINRAGKAILLEASQAVSNDDAASIKERIFTLKKSCDALISLLPATPLFENDEVLSLFRDHRKAIIASLKEKRLSFPLSFTPTITVLHSNSSTEYIEIVMKEDLANSLPYKIGNPRPVLDTDLGKTLVSRGESPYETSRDSLGECRLRCKDLLYGFSQTVQGLPTTQAIQQQLRSLRFCIEDVLEDATETFQKSPPSESQLIEYMSCNIQIIAERQFAPDDSDTEYERWVTQRQNTLSSLTMLIATHSSFNNQVIEPLAKLLLESLH